MAEKTEPKKDEKEKLGDYGGEMDKLTQDQMLGQGGGVEFYEILDATGKCRVHVAMPCLLRDRPKVKAAMRKHALSASETAKILSSHTFDDKDETEKQLEETEEQDTDALLTIAYYSFKRTDAALEGKGEADGKKEIENWIDELQLRRVLQVALGLNRFELPSRMGAV